MPKQLITARLDPALWRKLQDQARRNRRSATKELEVAIEEHVQREHNPVLDLCSSVAKQQSEGKETNDGPG